MKWIIPIVLLLTIPLVYGMKECQSQMTPSDIPCLLVSSWEHRGLCSDYTATIYYSNNTILDTVELGENLISGCNITFNYTAPGIYVINDTSGDYAIIYLEEDDNMLMALVIGVAFIVGLFIFLTTSSKHDKPFLANFFFLGVFIFATVLSNLIWKITNINTSPYEPIMLVLYRVMLIITVLMIFIVLVLLTVDAVKIRKIQGNPIDSYHDNLGK